MPVKTLSEKSQIPAYDLITVECGDRKSHCKKWYKCKLIFSSEFSAL